MVATVEQLDAALTYCLDFAKEMLTKRGAFYPFGASISMSGKIAAVGGWDGNEHPAAAEIYSLISGALRSEAAEKKISGSALAVDVNIPPQYQTPWPDGIRVHLESAEYSRYIYIPYRIVKSGMLRTKTEVKLAEPVAVEIGHEVFVKNSA